MSLARTTYDGYFYSFPKTEKLAMKQTAAFLALVIALVGCGGKTNGPSTRTVLDDFEGGTNQNRLGYWWYFYDDSANYGGPNSRITNASKNAELIYTAQPISSEGRNGSACLRMDYQIGPNKVSCGVGCGYAFVGAGTMLADNGKTYDLARASRITFWAKASPSRMVNIKIATSDVTDFGFYAALLAVGPEWQHYTVSLVPGTGINQPSWAKKVDFDTKNVTKIEWELHTDQFPEAALPVVGTLWLDEIVIEGSTRILF
jgi:hypothetical protein